MIPADIQNEVQNRLGFVINSFGGIDNFKTLLAKTYNLFSNEVSDFILDETSRTEINIYFKELLTYDADVIVISPWAYVFSFLNEDNLNVETSIRLDSPYKVYKPNGDLIYSVTQHNGFFGKSFLDKSLLVQSQSTNYYYLQYFNYLGDAIIKIILINTFTNQVLRNSPYSNTRVTSEIEDNLVSQLLIVFKNTLNIEDIYRIHYLKAAPEVNKTAVDIVNDSTAEVITFASRQQFVFTFQEPGWLVITRNFVPLSNDPATGSGIQKIISASTSNDINYLGVGLTDQLLKSTFNTNIIRAEFNTLNAQIEVNN